MITVRALTVSDAAAFQAIRLRSLKEHPEAFAMAYEDEKDIPLAEVAKRFETPARDRIILGAFDEDTLIGLVGGYQDSLRKCKHRAHLGPMYVAAEARRQGAGRLLLREAITALRAIDGVEEIVLAVTVGNDAARALYASAGFETAYIEPRFFKIDGQYYDLDWMILRLIP
jgi:ribosomal protein S18 acetylase RimI-like enzyme